MYYFSYLRRKYYDMLRNHGAFTLFAQVIDKTPWNNHNYFDFFPEYYHSCIKIE